MDLDSKIKWFLDLVIPEESIKYYKYIEYNNVPYGENIRISTSNYFINQIYFPDKETVEDLIKELLTIPDSKINYNQQSCIITMPNDKINIFTYFKDYITFNTQIIGSLSQYENINYSIITNKFIYYIKKYI